MPSPLALFRIFSLTVAVLAVAVSVLAPTARAQIAPVEVVCPGGIRTPFSDVGPANLHRESVGCLAALDIVAGLPDGRFAPDQPVRRDQQAALLARGLGRLGVALPANPPDAFADDDASVHRLAIDQLAALGIVAGTCARTFDPAGGLRRDQLAAVLVRAFTTVTGSAAPTGGDHFADDDGTTHEAAIDAAVALGLVRGRTATTYDIASAVRRDQQASATTGLLATLIDDGAGQVPRSPADLALTERFGAVDVVLRAPDGATTTRRMLHATSGEQHARGLMGVTHPDLAGHDGMLFAFAADVQAGFFMQGTPMPLSIAWFAADGTLVGTADMAPCRTDVGCPTYRSDAPYRYAVEVPQGRLATIGIVPGARLEVPAS
ncbi:hypothetical protein BH20ACT2_BH20ACT2_08700 [soil metagenome]